MKSITLSEEEKGNYFVTAQELARLLHCHVNTIRKWAVIGKLPGRKLPGGWRFDGEAIQVFCRGGQNGKQ